MLTLRTQRRAAAVLFVVLTITGVASAGWVLRYGWAIHKLTRGVGDTVFLDRHGRAWFRMDEQRRDVPLAKISPHLQHAVVAVEDHRFFRHPGIDPLALGRAVVRNVADAGVVEGGSTLTQQLARTLFLTNQRTWGRKIREAGIALLLESQLTKGEILELYLNRIYISAGHYGVETMSRNLFGKPAEQVTLPEAALIAGLIRAPGALSPWSNPERAIRRSHVVLTRMREQGFITAAQEAQAKRTRVRMRPYPAAQQARAGYAKEYLRQQFRNRFGGDHPPDWTIETTFDPALQDLAERAVQQGLRRVSRRGDLQAALVAIDPRTGDILAMVGGRDFSKSQFNRAVRSHRQPGSAFKPFVYAAALERGYSPASVLQGLASIPPQGPDEWLPRNADGDEAADELTLRQALIESDNRAATAMQRKIGARPVLRLASSLGMKDLPDVPSLALGSGEVTPLELTAAFAVFANHGSRVRPRALRRVADAQGSTVLRQDVEEERVLNAPVAFQMQSMLRDVIDRGTGSAARRLGVLFPAGGKTGTTDDFHDAWFVGFSSEIVVGVWVGLDQPATIARGAYGARLALPIWADFMRRAARAYRPQEFERPAGLQEETLCSISYLRPVEDCPTYTEYFKEGDDVPGKLCPLHEGSLKQRARRAVQEFLSELGRALKDVFRDARE
ncbi:MAG TPA: PBP1A family penicillin-binding protein [Vicinamibacterales bacterium]|nr:PBP1A family penicillin-binding protein [Vicinamibacterales bacterium]